MKILYLVNHFYPCLGGVEKVALELAKGMGKRGHEVKVVCLNKCWREGKKLKENENVEGIEVKRIPFLNLRYYKVAPGFWGELKWADLVHVHGTNFFSDYALFTKFLHKKKIVVSTHGGIFHTKKVSALKKIYFNVCARLLLKAADRVAADSENDCRIFSGIVPKKKMVLAGNGVEVEKFFSLKTKKIPGRFLAAGRVSMNKRIDRLLEAFGLLKKDFSLHIAGPDFDGLEKGLKEKAAEQGISGKTRFLGKISEERLLDEFGAAEFFVSASEFEGFGVSVIEAMASGAIPVVNNIPAFRELVKEGENGFLADFSDAEKAAEKIWKIMELNGKEKERIIGNGKKFSERFGWKKKAEEFEEIYGGLK